MLEGWISDIPEGWTLICFQGWDNGHWIPYAMVPRGPTPVKCVRTHRWLAIMNRNDVIKLAHKEKGRNAWDVE